MTRQRQVGLDVVNDGEAGKVMYSTYVQDRLTGYHGRGPRDWGEPIDFKDFPDLYEKLLPGERRHKNRLSTQPRQINAALVERVRALCS